MRVYYGEHFRKNVKRLDEKQQNKLAKLVVLLKDNPFDSLLHTKKLSGDLTGIYSFRVNRNIRTLFRFLSPDEIIIIDVGNRKDIYRLK